MSRCHDDKHIVKVSWQAPGVQSITWLGYRITRLSSIIMHLFPKQAAPHTHPENFKMFSNLF